MRFNPAGRPEIEGCALRWVELRFRLAAGDLVVDLVIAINLGFGTLAPQHRFAHREHRARRVSYHPLGGAADFAGLAMSEAARRHDNQVGVQFFGGFGDLIERAAVLDHNFTTQGGIYLPATQDV